jgi:IS30 family transposase
MRGLPWSPQVTTSGAKGRAPRNGTLSAHRLVVYFCDPHSPWQRGSNENMNGLVRQYLPEGTDLWAHSQEELDAIADEINGRARKGMGVRSPLAVYRDLLLNHHLHSPTLP